MLESTSEREFTKVSTWVPWIALCLSSLLLVIYFYRFQGEIWDPTQFAAFGDFTGGILNPILSFLTILLLVFSIKFQLEELKLTRDEMRNSTKELAENNKLNSELVYNQIVMFNTQSVKQGINEIEKDIRERLNAKIEVTSRTTNFESEVMERNIIWLIRDKKQYENILLENKQFRSFLEMEIHSFCIEFNAIHHFLKLVKDGNTNLNVIFKSLNKLNVTLVHLIYIFDITQQIILENELEDSTFIKKVNYVVSRVNETRDFLNKTLES